MSPLQNKIFSSHTSNQMILNSRINYSRRGSNRHFYEFTIPSHEQFNLRSPRLDYTFGTFAWSMWWARSLLTNCQFNSNIGWDFSIGRHCGHVEMRSNQTSSFWNALKHQTIFISDLNFKIPSFTRFEFESFSRYSLFALDSFWAVWRILFAFHFRQTMGSNTRINTQNK